MCCLIFTQPLLLTPGESIYLIDLTEDFRKINLVSDMKKTVFKILS